MKKWLVIHPFLFAIFPILFLFSHNIKEMTFSDIVRPTVMVVSFTFLLWLLLTLLVKDKKKSGIIASIFLLLFFSYGHLWDCVPDILRNIAYFHFFLFALFPILFLFSPNIKEMSFIEIVRSTVILTSFTFLLWFLLTSFIKNKRKSATVTIIFLLAIICYGQLMNRVLMYSPLNETYFVLFWALIFISSTFLVIRTRRKLHNLTNYLNIVSIFLVAFPTITIMVHRIGSRDYPIREGQVGTVSSEKSKKYKERRVGTVNLEESKNYPDIYYLILDGYARADILEGFYQYDNSRFLKYLAQKGFYIANRSKSNYSQTNLSLASSLNLTYLDELAKQMGRETNDRAPLREMFWNSRVAEFLKEHGYLIVAFSSGIASTEMRNANIFITRPIYLSEFENLLLNTTLISIILAEKTQYDLHRDRLLYILRHLADLTKLDTPVFVFAHIMAPHPPFVFGENGEEVKPNREFSFDDGAASMVKDEYVEGYRNQLIFINEKIVATINKIISKSPQPPIIILQADHGPGSMLDWKNLDDITFKERMSILNAYYLPHDGHNKLYEEITPVNTFRIIFNHYFGTNLELLEDKCYFSTWHHPYEFIDLTDKINSD